jgi:hypothetical protein
MPRMCDGQPIGLAAVPCVCVRCVWPAVSVWREQWYYVQRSTTDYGNESNESRGETKPRLAMLRDGASHPP